MGLNTPTGGAVAVDDTELYERLDRIEKLLKGNVRTVTEKIERVIDPHVIAVCENLCIELARFPRELPKETIIEKLIPIVDEKIYGLLIDIRDKENTPTEKFDYSGIARIDEKINQLTRAEKYIPIDYSFVDILRELLDSINTIQKNLPVSVIQTEKLVPVADEGLHKKLQAIKDMLAAPSEKFDYSALEHINKKLDDFILLIKSVDYSFVDVLSRKIDNALPNREVRPIVHTDMRVISLLGDVINKLNNIATITPIDTIEIKKPWYKFWQ